MLTSAHESQIGQLISFLLLQTYIKQMLVDTIQIGQVYVVRKKGEILSKPEIRFHALSTFIRAKYKISVNHIWYG
jgi:hypothetical protein